MKNKYKIISILICLTLVTASLIIVSAKKPENPNPSNFIELPPIEQPAMPVKGFIIYCDISDGTLKTLDMYGETTVLAIPQPPPFFYDDFEDSTFDKWNIALGSWEIISEGENHVAHVIRSSVWGRKIVTKVPMPDDMIIEGLAKGDATGDIADTSIGFYSNAGGTSFYHLVFGGQDGNKLSIMRVIEGSETMLTYNPSVIPSNNVWYNFKIILDNNNIYAKIWQIGSIEPIDWQISYSVASPFGNYIFVGAYAGQDNEEFWFDNICVRNFT